MGGAQRSGEMTDCISEDPENTLYMEMGQAAGPRRHGRGSEI